jgi:hypothetical protein
MVLLLLPVAPFGLTPGRAAPGSGSGARSQTPRSTEVAGEATSQERIDALAEARAVGTLGVTDPIRSDPAPGWAGEKVMSRKADDWEPAVAADPAAPYVYTLHNRFGVRACRHCPDPPMILNVSSNDGRTFGPDAFICRCRGVGEQFDPEIEVVPTTGEVYAVWMNDWHVVFSKSSDHGVTWSKPVRVYGTLRWSDKPILTTSQDGQDVYVGFNGATAGDAWISASHDAGQTFTPVLVMRSEQYTYAYGGYVAPDGTVTFTDISYWYTGPGGKAEGPTEIHAFTSTDGGLTWTNTVVDSLELGAPCTSKACYVDFYDSDPALAGDANGHLVMVYNGAAIVKGPQTVYARSSTDGGLTWSDRVALSPEGVNAAFPAAVGTGDGEVRAWFADQRTGRWNIWYTASMDLGATWGRRVRISDATSGTVYKSRKGFLEFYGDYGEIAITSTGATFAIWGESLSYAGPGGCWYNRQVPV